MVGEITFSCGEVSTQTHGAVWGLKADAVSSVTACLPIMDVPWNIDVTGRENVCLSGC